MKFEWDNSKATQNIKKHGVSFELATTVFSDSLHLSIEEQTAREERWITIGVAANQSMLLVVHTHRVFVNGYEVIRIISARKASRKERRQYEEGI